MILPVIQSPKLVVRWVCTRDLPLGLPRAEPADWANKRWLRNSLVSNKKKSPWKRKVCLLNLQMFTWILRFAKAGIGDQVKIRPTNKGQKFPWLIPLINQNYRKAFESFVRMQFYYDIRQNVANRKLYSTGHCFKRHFPKMSTYTGWLL